MDQDELLNILQQGRFLKRMIPYNHQYSINCT